MAVLKVSLCITTFNEEKSIKKLLDSIILQTRKPDEIILVDGGSTDETISIINSYKNKLKNLKLIVYTSASISKGRNLAVKNSKKEVIAMTDAGCVCDKNWLKNITEPFKNKSTSVVAGFYKMTGKSKFQQSLKKYLGVLPKNFDDNFLPSTRSIAFRKNIWESVKGFDEKFDKAGEDTDFNQKILKNNFKIVRVKKAIVFWEVADNLKDACKKFFYYARGDVQSGKLTKHNIKVLTIFLRYFIFILICPLFIVYLFYSYWKAGLWGIIIQVSSDFAIMLGFLNGIYKTNN
ncbi:MAG TPA: glycosyltransferase [Patescibacteria group bacterium]|nr:glycosyltransferase [Patescibacteria group bacterium]